MQIEIRYRRFDNWGGRLYDESWEGDSQVIKAKLLRIYDHALRFGNPTCIENDIRKSIQQAMEAIRDLEDRQRKSWV
jgi:hypothetical protein